MNYCGSFFMGNSWDVIARSEATKQSSEIALPSARNDRKKSMEIFK
jgi:hypothetical protein